MARLNNRAISWAAVLAACICFANLCCLTHQQNLRSGPGGDKVIVHLFEWAWKDVGLECKNFLGPKGFKAVQMGESCRKVSPPQEDRPGDAWWTRYQPVSYKLSSRSGDEGEFKAMVDMCRDAGVDVVVDVVLNHMANFAGVGRAGSTINSKCDFPGTYQCKDFHNYCSGGCSSCCNCEIDFNTCNADNYRHCNLGGLPDLDTASNRVRTLITGYLNKLASLGVAGVRVDASKHIDTVDMAAILANVNTSLYLNHEVVLNGGERTQGNGCIQASEFYSFGKVWEFKTPGLFSEAFNHQQNLQLLRNMNSESRWPGDNSIWAQSQNALSFVVNHDRLVHAGDRATAVTIFDYGYALANVILLAHPYGQPVVLSSLNFIPNAIDYQGSPVNVTADCSGTGKCGLIGVYDRNDPNSTMPMRCAYGDLNSSAPYHCEHRWPAIANMVAWRSVAGLTGITYNGQGIQYFGNKQMAITRGNGNFGMAFAFVNIDGFNGFDADVDTKGMPAGQYCNVLSSDSACWPCTKACTSTVTVLSNGITHLAVNKNDGVAFHFHGMVPVDSPPPPPSEQPPSPLPPPTPAPCSA